MDDSADVGYFVDSEDEGELEDECEPLSRYREGLYYPVCIGEVLNGRYRVLHKLGWGGFSTVWLARDLDQRTVALKIMVADERGDTELPIQAELIQKLDDTSNLTLYTAAFQLRGADDHHHLCLVLPLRGTSLSDYHTRVQKPITERMSVARTALHALASVHSVGIIHRDLNLGAILWELQSIDHLTNEDIYRLFCRPRKMKIGDLGWKSGEIVQRMQGLYHLLGSSAYLGDFGMSIHAGTPVEYTVQAPMSFCAPERYHGAQPSYASDLWSYICIFATLYLSVEVVWGHGTLSVARLVDALGPLPKEWKGSYCGPGEAEDWWYDCTGLLPRPNYTHETLEHKVDRLRPDIGREERELVLSILHQGFSYHPEQRLTATNLLASPEFVALMGNYGL